MQAGRLKWENIGRTQTVENGHQRGVSGVSGKGARLISLNAISRSRTKIFVVLDTLILDT